MPKELSKEEYKALSADEKKAYLSEKLASQGAMDVSMDSGSPVETEPEEDPSLVSNIPPEEDAPPLEAGEDTEPEAHSDLPPSVRGEDVPVDEGESPPSTEAEDGDIFLEVNERTKYKSAEDAIKGLNEKDRTIDELKHRLREAEERKNLSDQQLDSMQRRLERLEEATRTSPQEDNRGPEPSKEGKPKREKPEIPDSKDEQWDMMDENPKEFVQKVIEAYTADLAPAIELAQKLKEMGADRMLAEFQAMGAQDILREQALQRFYGSIDTVFPEFEGKWREEGTNERALFERTWEELNPYMKETYGVSLDEAMERGDAQSTKWAINSVLNVMRDKNNGASSDGVTTPRPAEGAPPGHAQRTPAGGQGASRTTPVNGQNGGSQARFTKEEVESIVAQAVDSKSKELQNLVEKAAQAQSQLHGGSQTEGAGATQPQADDQQPKVWTREEMKNDPEGYRRSRMNNPAFATAKLDLLNTARR